MKIQRTNSVSVHLAILRVAGVLVPSQQRAEWFAEWRAELWYARQSCVRESQMAPGNVDVTAFCLGAFKDALWLRRNRPRRKVRDIFCLDSPSRCLVLLAGLGAISLLSAYLLLGTLESNAREEPSPVRAFLMIIGFACLIAPATTALSLGDYPASCHAPSLATRLRRWIFLAAKIGFILPIVYGGALHMRYFSVTGRDVAANFLVHALLWGGVFALGWVLRDQRRRCPVCLRLLTNPVRVGQAAGCSGKLDKLVHRAALAVPGLFVERPLFWRASALNLRNALRPGRFSANRNTPTHASSLRRCREIRCEPLSLYCRRRLPGNPALTRTLR